MKVKILLPNLKEVYSNTNGDLILISNCYIVSSLHGQC